MIKPRIAIVPGDPSGIGPELIPKLKNDEGVLDAANVLLVGDTSPPSQIRRRSQIDI